MAGAEAKVSLIYPWPDWFFVPAAAGAQARTARYWPRSKICTGSNSPGKPSGAMRFTRT